MIDTPPAEQRLIWILAAVQFTHILDFMVMMPLGPQLMALFDIDAVRFGVLISAYTAAAAVASLLAALVLDRFDRRVLLRLGYFLFALATIACGLANTFEQLLIARTTAGLFGGLIGVLVQTIVADVVPFERRGRAMGLIMAAFSVSTVAGVPLALFAANQFGWHAPFLVLGIGSLAILAIAWPAMPSVRGHLDAPAGVSMLRAFANVLATGHYWLTYAFTLTMIFTGFTVIPFITVYLQGNLGLDPAKVPAIYLAGGVATLMSSPLIGRLADRFGKECVYRYLAVLALVPLIGITHLASDNLFLILMATTAFFVLVSGRMIPAMALVGSVPAAHQRGAFMALNNMVQSGGMALASFVGGWLAGSVDTELAHYAWNGWVGAVSSLVSIALLWWMLHGRHRGMPMGTSAA